jgi:hypothetical protein
MEPKAGHVEKRDIWRETLEHVCTTPDRDGRSPELMGRSHAGTWLMGRILGGESRRSVGTRQPC